MKKDEEECEDQKVEAKIEASFSKHSIRMVLDYSNSHNVNCMRV